MLNKSLDAPVNLSFELAHEVYMIDGKIVRHRTEDYK